MRIMVVSSLGKHRCKHPHFASVEKTVHRTQGFVIPIGMRVLGLGNDRMGVMNVLSGLSSAVEKKSLQRVNLR